MFGSSYAPQSHEAELERLFALPRPPTALFAANDELAGAALRTLARRGLRVPGDVAVVGYADYAFSEYLELTTIHQDALEMGRCAARRLMQRMSSPALPLELTLLPTRLVIRRTCGGKTLNTD